MTEMSPQSSNPQLTDTVVMISPDQFGFNPQTDDNVYQHRPANEIEARNNALEEFRVMVETLQAHDIAVVVLPTPVNPNEAIPDAIFPNNWVSHHSEGSESGGTLVIYPMRTPNRRAERQIDNLKGALTSVGISSPDVVDFTADENEGRILEGTGSLVLDREHKIAYAMESQRTTKEEFDAWCSNMGYEGVFFHAQDATRNGQPVYHTNVVMSVGKEFAVLCSDAIPDANERAMVEQRLQDSGKNLIRITVEQMGMFCGNVLQVLSTKGEPKIVMSQNAHDAFTDEQKQQLSHYGELVVVNIPTIEDVGGGSARCMLAEVFPPKK